MIVRSAALFAEHGVEYDVVSEVLRIMKEHAREQAKREDRTPLVLRQSHDEMLDRIAASMGLRRTPSENRQLLTLTIMDALAATDLPAQHFRTSEELRQYLHKALARR